MTRCVSTALFTSALVSMIWAQSPAAFAERTEVRLTDPSSPPRLRVELEWGSIRLAGDPEAEALSLDSIPDRPEQLAGGLITVRETANRVDMKQAPLASGAFRSANLEITTPARADLMLLMHRGGDIRVRGVHGLVEVTNLNGSVELTGLAGAAAVNASNGSISAAFDAVDPDRDMIFATLNGSVTLCLPADFSGQVHLSTAGDVIRSDFRIQREEAARTVGPGEALAGDGAEVRGRIGAGGALLRVSTPNGEISLQRCGASG